MGLEKQGELKIMSTKISEKELLSTASAQIWAKAFIQHKEDNNWKLEDIDEGLMIGWFTNAMETAKASI